VLRGGKSCPPVSASYCSASCPSTCTRRDLIAHTGYRQVSRHRTSRYELNGGQDHRHRGTIPFSSVYNDIRNVRPKAMGIDHGEREELTCSIDKLCSVGGRRRQWRVLGRRTWCGTGRSGGISPTAHVQFIKRITTWRLHTASGCAADATFDRGLRSAGGSDRRRVRKYTASPRGSSAHRGPSPP